VAASRWGIGGSLRAGAAGADDPGVPNPSPGLCEGCRHGRTVRGARSIFWRCARADTEPEFPRYPALPVLRCRGFEAAVAQPEAAP
jgi:hypothetical protein